MNIETPQLRFLNHASYIVETPHALLLHDPWFEGTVFNDGWALLSNQMSNQDVLTLLLKSNKKIFLWVSHEHPDHLNIAFIKHLVSANLDFEIFFQKTADQRVASFLRGLGVRVHECTDGHEYELSSGLGLTVFRHSEGDSLSLLRAGSKTILNLNDCVIDSQAEAERVSSLLPRDSKIDILFTQFGYASWLGTEADSNLRVEAANEKIERLNIQNNTFKPEAIILFASFIYFCRPENFFINSQQNTPSKIRGSTNRELPKEKIFLMRPGDQLTLNEGIVEALTDGTIEAERYWNGLFNDVLEGHRVPETPRCNGVDIENLVALAEKYRRRVLKHLLFIPAIFELTHLMQVAPVKFEITDLNCVLVISYRHRPKVLMNSTADVILTSHDIAFILREEFGWNSVIVGGTFQANISSLDSYNSFFWYQDLLKNGVSVTRPKKFFSVLLYLLKGLIQRRIGARLLRRWKP